MSYIAVVVPVYNVQDYLHRCIESILEQKYKDFILVLVDDGSPDECGQICDKYEKTDNRIKVIHQENKGLSGARNTGIEWALQNTNCEWITFIDSDDFVHKDYLNELFICSKTNCTKISCCHFLKTETKENYVSLEEKSYVISPEDFWVQEQGTATVAWGKLYDINLFKDIRYPEGRIHEDEFTTYKLLFNNDYISVSPRELYYYFQSPVSIMRSKWSVKKLDGLEAYENQMLYFSQNKFKNALKESTKLHTYALKNNFSIIKDSGQKEYKKLIYKMIGNFLYKKYHFKFLKMIFFCKLFIYNSYFTLFFNVRFFVAKKIYKRNGIKGLFNKANSIIAKYLIKYRKKH